MCSVNILAGKPFQFLALIESLSVATAALSQVSTDNILFASILCWQRTMRWQKTAERMKTLILLCNFLEFLWFECDKISMYKWRNAKYNITFSSSLAKFNVSCCNEIIKWDCILKSTYLQFLRKCEKWMEMVLLYI